ncbi:MAG: cysteine-rich CWC family protein [Vicinamibacterales bacterium]
MTDQFADPARCPLCGEDNRCGMAKGDRTCWCASRQIPAEALQRVPEPLKGVACLCERCATARIDPPESLADTFRR